VNGALSASCGYGFAGSLHVDFNPAVLRPSFAGLIFRNRLAFAEALSGNAPVGNALFNDIVADRGNAPPPPKPKPKPAMSYSISTGAISNRKVPTEELQTDMDV